MNAGTKHADGPALSTPSTAGEEADAKSDDGAGGSPGSPSPSSASPPTHSQGLLAKTEQPLQRAVEHLLSLQHDDGHWCAELEGDSILQSEYILALWICGLEEHPKWGARLPGLAKYLREQQRDSGAWGQYPGGALGGGAVDLSATVKGYFALKLMGDDPQAEHMRKAREVILEHGGAERINSFSKYYLAALGQVKYSAVPTVPPQMVYLPRMSYFHLDKVSAWSRTMIVPLAIVTSHKPVRELPKHLHIDELFKSEKDRHRLLATGFGQSKAWTSFFLGADKALKVFDKTKVLGLLRERALKRMESWIAEHCKGSDGPGAIFPPIVYLLIAFLKCRGYKLEDPIIQDNLKHLDNYMIYGRAGKPRNKPEDAPADDDTIHMQPCESPVWDTGIAAYALTDCGHDGDKAFMKRCSDWLLSKECRQRGDWTANVKDDVAFSGWFFEYNNPWYPDVDDTVMVSMALKRIATPELPEVEQAAKRSLAWVRAMQNKDGGWAAFDKGTQGRPILDCVPFADHNAMQDPSCPDITGRTLECLGHHGITADDPNVKRAIDFIHSRQEPEGCWFGRWGVNYIYGTWQVVGGLRGVGYDMTQPWVQQAGNWLRSVQKLDGSFGESCDSYEDPSLKGQGPSTASQTAWGAMSLMAIFGPEDPGVHKAIEWLIDTQLDNGNWDEPWFTGTGFPKVFYLRYHYYKLYFPIMCIGRWRSLTQHP